MSKEKPYTAALAKYDTATELKVGDKVTPLYCGYPTGVVGKPETSRYIVIKVGRKIATAKREDGSIIKGYTNPAYYQTFCLGWVL